MRALGEELAGPVAISVACGLNPSRRLRGRNVTRPCALSGERSLDRTLTLLRCEVQEVDAIVSVLLGRER
jgi:hypothetical protein